LQKLALFLSASDVNLLLGILVKNFPNNPNPECRRLYFQLLIALYDSPRLWVLAPVHADMGVLHTFLPLQTFHRDLAWCT
jgi:hypothetical protein